MTLRFEIRLVLAAAVIIPLASVVYISQSQTADLLRHNAEVGLRAQAQGLQRTLDQELHAWRHALLGIAATSRGAAEVRQEDTPIVDSAPTSGDLATRLLWAPPAFHWLARVDGEGVLVEERSRSGVATGLVGSAVAQAPWYPRSLNTPGDKAVRAHVTVVPQLTGILPKASRWLLMASPANVDGVSAFVAAIDLNELMSLAASDRPETSLYVFDADGSAIVAPEGAESVTLVGLGGVQTDGDAFRALRVIAGKAHVAYLQDHTATSLLPLDWHVGATQTHDSVFAVAKEGGRVLWLFTAVLVVLVFILLLPWIRRRVARPILGLVGDLTGTARDIKKASANILATCNQHNQSSAQQVSAIEETRRTMQGMLSLASEIATAAQEVLHNAESNQGNSQLVAQRIADLSAHTERIAEILQTIRSIAHKSDVLALNASLEGTHAGEVGKAFSFVAVEMRNLAEQVLESANLIEGFTTDIRKASDASTLATEHGIKLASQTTHSVRHIDTITRQQQTASKQVYKAMDDVSDTLSEAAMGTHEILAQTQSLTRLSARLEAFVSAFPLHEG